jgi:hypothetical protein
MAVFNCPECGALSQSNREATYYWCACGRPLTAADAVPGMADSVAEATASPPPVEQGLPDAEPLDAEPADDAEAQVEQQA